MIQNYLIMSSKNLHKKLKLITINARSLRTHRKQEKLNNIIANLNPDVVAITETNLQIDRTFQILGYYFAANTPRPLQNRKSGGGTAILVKNSIHATSTSIGVDDSEDIQCSTVKIEDVILSCIYRRPRGDTHFGDEDARMFERISRIKGRFVVTGDLNLHVDWANWTHKNRRACEVLHGLLSMGFIQTINEVTRPRSYTDDNSGNILDVFITRSNDLISDSEVLKNIEISDHYPISCCVNIIQHGPTREKIIVEDIKNADWTVYVREIEQYLIDGCDTGSVEDTNVKITEALKLAWSKAVPKKSVSFVKGAPVYPLSEKTKSIKKELEKLRKKYNRGGRNVEIRNQCRALQKVLEANIAQDIHSVQTSFLSKHGYSAKAVKRYLKRFRQVDDKFGPLKVNDEAQNPEITDDKIAANTMKDHFVSVYKPRVEFDFNYQPATNPPKMYDITFNEKEVEDAVKGLNNTGARSMDGINAEMLKRAVEVLKPHLARLFTMIYELGEYPESWLRSVVCPIHKGGKIKHRKNRYRPVSLVSVLLKTYESILYKHCSGWVSNKKVWSSRAGFNAGWSDKQFAYLPRSSVEGNLISLNRRIGEAKKCGVQLTNIYADAKAAFDALSFRNIGIALTEMGMPSKVIRNIMFGLTNRTFVVKVNETLSDPAHASSGILQGSKLSGFIFNTAINTIFSTAPPDLCPKSGMPYVALYGYADDVKFSYITSDLRGHALMVQHQKLVQEWADEHTYFIHPEKLVMLKMGHSDIVKEIKIGESVVKEVDHHRDLGIEYTSDGLDFKRVWDSKIAQMTRKSIELRSNIRTRSVVVLKQLWNTYLNSILLFGLSVIGYPDDKQLRKLMNIQRLFFDGAVECPKTCKKRTVNSDFCVNHTLPDPIDIIILKRDLINFNNVRLGMLRTVQPKPIQAESPIIRRTRNQLVGSQSRKISNKDEIFWFENRVLGDFQRIPTEIRNNAKEFANYVKSNVNCHLNKHIKMTRDRRNKKYLIGNFKSSSNGELGPAARRETRSNQRLPNWPTKKYSSLSSKR